MKTTGAWHRIWFESDIDEYDLIDEIQVDAYNSALKDITSITRKLGRGRININVRELINQIKTLKKNKLK